MNTSYRALAQYNVIFACAAGFYVFEKVMLMMARMRIDNCAAKATHATVANRKPRPLVDPALALCNAATIIHDGMPAEIVAKVRAGWKELSGHHGRSIAEKNNRGSTPLSIGMLSKLFKFSADMGR